MPFTFTCERNGQTVKLKLPDQTKQMLDFANRLRDPYLVRYLMQLSDLVNAVAKAMAADEEAPLTDVRVERLKDQALTVLNKLFPDDRQQAQAYAGSISDILDRAKKAADQQKEQSADKADYQIDTHKEHFRLQREEYQGALETVEGKWNTGKNREDPKAWLDALEDSIGVNGDVFQHWVDDRTDINPFANSDVRDVVQTVTAMVEYCYYDEGD